jgi:hypothetical protein
MRGLVGRIRRSDSSNGYQACWRRERRFLPRRSVRPSGTPWPRKRCRLKDDVRCHDVVSRSTDQPRPRLARCSAGGGAYPNRVLPPPSTPSTINASSPGTPDKTEASVGGQNTVRWVDAIVEFPGRSLIHPQGRSGSDRVRRPTRWWPVDNFCGFSRLGRNLILIPQLTGAAIGGRRPFTFRHRRRADRAIEPKSRVWPGLAGASVTASARSSAMTARS